MLRVHCVRLFYNMSDPGMEDMLCEVESVRRFAGLRMDALPDGTTILKFRHLLEEHALGEGLKAVIDGHLESRGLSLREGTVVDASIVAAPSSTKNRDGKRDPEMHQTRKGRQWHFGMKIHVGADAETGSRTASRSRRRTSPTWRTRTACRMAARRGCGATRATGGWRSAAGTSAAAWSGAWRWVRRRGGSWTRW